MKLISSLPLLCPAVLALLTPAASKADDPAVPADAAPAPVVPKDPAQPLAGWHGGLFYLRDENDNFRLYVQARAQVDAYSYFGPGVSDTKLNGTIFLRRIRPELSGEFLHRWQWQLAGDWGQSSVDNAGGKSQTAPGTFADAQTASIKAVATDVYLNFRADQVFNLQVGQYDAPFTMENRTSDKYIPFMERSLAVRVLGIPTNKDIGAMAWGETSDRLLFYSIGIFNGDGQNRPNLDNDADVMGRVFTHPLDGTSLKGVQVGASFRYGIRNGHYIYYPYSNMTTQGTYTFWKSSYGTTHVIPSGAQMGFAGELRIPVEQFDLTSELVYVKNDTREAFDGLQDKSTQRSGDLHGYSYYVSLGWWPLGNRDINGQPGYENPAHVDFQKKDPEIPSQALQLLLKWEQLHVTYAAGSRTNTVPVDPAANIDGDIKVNALSLGANYWASKHVRLSANYVVNMFPDSAPVKATSPGGPVQNSSQRAIAPGNTIDAGANNDARDNAHVLHEFLGRVAVAF